MGENVAYLPLWKKGATPEERLMEVAAIARNHPERFSKLAVIYIEDTGKSDVTRYACNGVTTLELLGLLELAREEVLDVTRRGNG